MNLTTMKIKNNLDISYFGIKFKGEINNKGFYYDLNNGIVIDNVKRKNLFIEEMLFLFKNLIWCKL